MKGGVIEPNVLIKKAWYVREKFKKREVKLFFSDIFHFQGLF